MCESGGPNPPSHYQFDVLQFLYKIVSLQVFALDSCHVGARWYARAATSGIPARPIRMYVALLCMRVYILSRSGALIDCMRTEGRVDGCVPLFEQRLVPLALANAQLSFFFFLFFSPQ